MTALNITDLEELRHYVQITLCEQNELEIGAFQMSERILLRAGRPCGIFFCLHGPRSVKLTAIWESSGNTIRFYGSAGDRQHQVALQHGPDLELVAA